MSLYAWERTCGLSTDHVFSRRINSDIYENEAKHQVIDIAWFESDEEYGVYKVEWIWGLRYA